MKKAFTLLELIFVIVVIGILAAVILPNIKSNPLREAAVQLISHIRYTQHLALVNDRYDSNDAAWYKKRWRFSFNKGAGTNNMWSYTVWADTSGTGNPDPTEIAVNPQSKSKRLTGGSSGTGMIHTGDVNATNEMNLGEKYSVMDVAFSASCKTGATSKSLAFDHFGRPLRGALKNYTSAYNNTAIATNILVSSQCQITLCSVSSCAAATSEEKVVIAVEPETGYAHILP
jgi:prepilin-type N-terminal cleavage/methylation domain-containing protein